MLTLLWTSRILERERKTRQAFAFLVFAGVVLFVVLLAGASLFFHHYSGIPGVPLTETRVLHASVANDDLSFPEIAVCSFGAIPSIVSCTHSHGNCTAALNNYTLDGRHISCW